MHLFLRFLILMLLPFASSARAGEVYTLTRSTHVYFKGGDNQRERTFKAQLPSSSAAYRQATLKFTLSCPGGFCDAWDRTGSFGIVDEASGTYFELMRFMTPYGLGESWTLDLTPFLPLLQGERTFRVFIDTWVGPGHPQGNGWLVDASLDLEVGSIAEGRPVYVQPLLSFADVVYGDPSRSTRREAQLLPLIGYSSAQIVSTITGHGQGNAENCAEFCPKIHRISVGQTSFERRVWRDNCATSVNPNQKGTYQYSRAGWCPGDKVEPWSIDITQALLSGDLGFAYQPENYENTCRPDASSCKGCSLGTGCGYDDGRHTEPRYYVSSYVIYRE